MVSIPLTGGRLASRSVAWRQPPSVARWLIPMLTRIER